MERYHPGLELAPRDVVARAITREGMGTAPGEVRLVYLDLRHVQMDLHQRFPGISAFLAKQGLDLHRDLIPVRPAAHYMMGGIRTDLDGRSTLSGLYAAGEVACTGVHGANRLASNSLLEGLVFGARAAQAMRSDATVLHDVVSPQAAPASLTAVEEARIETLITGLQAAMWSYAGLLRDESTLREGLAAQQAFAAELALLEQQGKNGRRLAEAVAMSSVARAILQSALARTESRGAHYRNDFPQRDDANFQKHSIYRGEDEIVFEKW